MEDARTDEELPPRRQSSVYQLLSEEEITSIHVDADTLFNVVDRNGDGAISKEELGAHLLLARYTEESIESLFDLIDVDRDGEVTRSELREAFVRYPTLRDAPAMGSLGKSERAAVHDEADETFSGLDLNGDGELSLSDLQAHFAKVEGPTYSDGAVETIFMSLDTDSNGTVSRSEFREGYVSYRAMRLALGKDAAEADS